LKNILLIGGGGFLGKHLINAFNEDQYNKIFVLNKTEHADFKTEKTFIGDIGDASFLANSIAEAKPDLIYYLITEFSLNSMDEYVNAVKSSVINLNKFFQCLNPDIRIVYLGSSAQYGRVPFETQPVTEKTGFNPVTNYGVLKAFEEIQIRQLSERINADMIIARIFNVTGPGEPVRMVGGAFVSQLIKGNMIEVGNLFPKRDFLDIRDVADALKIIGIDGKPWNVYNICSGKSISIKDYLGIIINVMDCEPEIIKSSDRINKIEIDDLVGDNNKLRDLGWEARYSLDQSVKDLVESYR
jgi:GDP-4-dehydro-6-deoxy-D-mannose reductase|tara:strand:- start:2688 stop:3584 length:897 start_codon:yes stop_codon:yes gene_type:complete